MTAHRHRDKPTPKDVTRSPLGAKPPYMRAKLAKAVNLIVLEGKNVRTAAGMAEMNESALSRAINRPEIAAHIEHMKAQLCLDADKLKEQAKALAIREGMRLMLEGKSEPVRARMVEFFAGEARNGPSISVNVDARSGGYEFVRPGQKLVDVTPTKPKPD